MKNSIYHFNIGNKDIIITLTGLGAILLGIAILVISITLGMVVLGFGIALITYKRGTWIDFNNNKFREFESMLGIAWGEVENFNEIEKLFINRVKVSRKMYAARSNHAFTSKGELYKGFVKFDGERKALVKEHKNRDTVHKALLGLKETTGLKIHENF